MAVLLDYQHVEISFNGNAVVHDVSFQLHPGEILGLVGESGSGKTTLLKAAMGLLGSSGMVTKGDIWFEGKNLPDLPPKEEKKSDLYFPVNRALHFYVMLTKPAKTGELNASCRAAFESNIILLWQQRTIPA